MKFRSLLLLLPLCFVVSCANKPKSDYDMTDPYGTGALDEFAGASAPDPATTSAATTPLADTTYNSAAAYGDKAMSKVPDLPKTTYTPAVTKKIVAKKVAVKKHVVVAKKKVTKTVAPVKKTMVVKKPVVSPKKVIQKKVIAKKVVQKQVVKKVAKPITHTVTRGDSLSRIADRQGLSVSTLKKLNGLKSDVIRPGQKIRVK